MEGYDAYFGTYDLEERTGKLTVRLEAAISPSNIGMEFVRTVHVADNRLTITLPTTSAAGVPLTRTLSFSRLD